MYPFRSIFLLLLLPLFAACTDDRATFEINGNAHSLSLIRITTFPWDKTAQYAVVASRMPECLRRHAMPNAGLHAKVEVYSPGNDAWILQQGKRMYVVETRTCEGFARLDAVPEDGMGPLMGTFQMRGENLVFVAAPKPRNEPAAAPAPASGGASGS
ncbi:hypothetical protein FACS1894158_16740 [Betaproteobacteria bacterium]|nr:hypothetical protein FACS1894158_16740 [Betaproteobacteria bacterium]